MQTNTPNKSFLYGGIFDLVNGTSYNSNHLANSIKFAALFYDGLLVLDSVITTPNPFSTYLESILKKYKDKTQLKTDYIIQLLRSGIIKPALRKGESMVNNWDQGLHGFEAGKWAYFDRGRGMKLLELVEENLPDDDKYFLWPPDMAEAKTTRFNSSLHKYLLTELKDSTIVNELSFKNLPKRDVIKNISRANDLKDKFIELIRNHTTDTRFRRGTIENLFKSHFNMDEKIMSVYPFIQTNRNTNIEYALAYYLLNKTSTIYQAYQAQEWSTIGGLSPNHSRSIIDEGLYSDIAPLKEFDQGFLNNQERILIEGNLDLSVIPIKTIIEFRSEAKIGQEFLFEQYTTKFNAVKSVSDEKSYVERRNDLMYFIGKTYLPEFFKYYRDAGNIINVKSQLIQSLPNTGLVTYALITSGEFITVASNPFLLALFILGNFPPIITAMGKLSEKIEHSLSIKKFIDINNCYKELD